MPKVTVLMPTYNVAPYVKEAIESVLCQSYPDFELLVMDDCSSDQTIDVVQSIVDPRVRLERNESNLGLADNLNRGLSLIHTEYVARMDGDDIAEPDWLEREVAVLDNHPEIGVCGGCAKRFGTNNSLVMLPETHEDCMVNMLFNCSTVVPVYRHELYSKHGLHYRKDAFPAEDYRFWADCIKVTRFYNVQKVLLHYRMHETQICTSLKDIQVGKANEVRRLMLEWLSENISDNDWDYFLNSFVEGEIRDRETLDERYRFAEKLCQLNKVYQHFDDKSLRRGLSKHIRVAVYTTVINDYFGNGYRWKAYRKYLNGGMAFKTDFRFEVKMFMKSVLGRNTSMVLSQKIHNLFYPALGQVLMLHRVVDHIGPQPKESCLEVTADFFAQELAALQKQGVDFIAMDQVADRLQSKNHKPFVCITFDDGYLDTFTRAYPILKERQIPFCVYMTRNFYRGTAKPHWNPDAKMMGVEQLQELGVDPLCTIGVHACSHPHLGALPSTEQRREIEECKSDLEQLLGRPVRHLAYPYGDYNQETLQIVRQLGFETAVTTSGRPVRSDAQMLELGRVSFMQPE